MLKSFRKYFAFSPYTIFNCLINESKQKKLKYMDIFFIFKDFPRVNQPLKIVYFSFGV